MTSLIYSTRLVLARAHPGSIHRAKYVSLPVAQTKVLVKMDRVNVFVQVILLRTLVVFVAQQDNTVSGVSIQISQVNTQYSSFA